MSSTAGNIQPVETKKKPHRLDFNNYLYLYGRKHSFHLFKNKRKNMKKLIGVVIILGVAILMTLTVPDKKAHKEAMMKAIKEYVDEATTDWPAPARTW